MKELYICIGSPKTGSTAIQSYLSRHYHDLQRRGVLFPCAGRNMIAHHPLAADIRIQFNQDVIPNHCFGECERGENWEALLKELKETEFSKAVISSEDFFILFRTGDLQAIEAIKEKLNAYQVKIVVYLRRQDLLVESLFNQAIKATLQTPISSSDFINKHPVTRRNYLEILDAWASIFGKENIIVRAFERGALPQGDVVLDFFDAIGCSNLPSALSDEGSLIERVKKRFQRSNKREVNERLTPCELMLKRELNKNSLDNIQCINLFEKIRVKALDRCKNKARFFMSPNEYQNLIKESEQVNREIEKKYYEKKKLFTPFESAESIRFSKLDGKPCYNYITSVALSESDMDLLQEEREILKKSLSRLGYAGL